MALTFVTLPFLSYENLPMRGPTMMAPTSAEMPPTMWMTVEPAKSMKLSSDSQPPPHAQPASIG